MASFATHENSVEKDSAILLAVCECVNDYNYIKE